MNEHDVLPAPTLEPPRPIGKFERERAAFRRMLAELCERYPNEYVAVHEERVVGHGTDEVALALRMYDEFGYQPIYVGLASLTPPVIRNPSNRRTEAR